MNDMILFLLYTIVFDTYYAQILSKVGIVLDLECQEQSILGNVCYLKGDNNIERTVSNLYPRYLQWICLSTYVLFPLPFLFHLQVFAY